MKTKLLDGDKTYFEIIVDDDLKTLFDLKKYISDEELKTIEHNNRFTDRASAKKNIEKPTLIPDTMGSRLSILRTNKKITLAKLAKNTGIDIEILKEYELNLRVISRTNLNKLSDFYNVDPTLIYDFNSQKKKQKDVTEEQNAKKRTLTNILINKKRQLKNLQKKYENAVRQTTVQKYLDEITMVSKEISDTEQKLELLQH